LSAGRGLSSIGDSITFTALPLLVLALTGSGLAMGVVGILQAVPDLLLGSSPGRSPIGWTGAG
jgi:MFS transporter, ENTS family, enterobactin (siderophore) exporter